MADDAASNSGPIARRRTQTLVPAGRVTVRVAAEPVLSRDRFTVHARLDLLLRLNDTPADAAALAEVFPKLEAVTASQVADALAGRVSDAAREACVTVDADDLVADPSRLLAALLSAVVMPLFSMGLRQDGPAEVTVESPDLDRRQAEEEGERVAREAADREGELLRGLEDLRRAHPHATGADLLARLSSDDRRQVVTATLRASSRRRPGRILLVGKDQLCEVDPATQAVRSWTVPGDLGPLRCVREGGRGLYLGCRDGILLAREGDGEFTFTVSSRVDTGNSPYGFSGVASADGRVWACHYEFGFVVWPAGDLSASPAAFRGEHATRNLAAAGNGLFTSQSRTVVRRGTREAAWEADEEVVALLGGREAVAVLRDGSHARLRVDGDSLTPQRLPDTRDTAAPVADACGLPWLDEVRPVHLHADGRVALTGLGDGVRSEVASPWPASVVAAGTDLIVTVSTDRQRVSAVRPWAPREVLFDLHVASQLRGRCADVAVV